MDLGSTLQHAATLMLTGMVVVFVFLTILVGLVKLMSRLIPEELPPQATATTPPLQVTIMARYPGKPLPLFQLLFINIVIVSAS